MAGIRRSIVSGLACGDSNCRRRLHCWIERRVRRSAQQLLFEVARHSGRNTRTRLLCNACHAERAPRIAKRAGESLDQHGIRHAVGHCCWCQPMVCRRPDIRARKLLPLLFGNRFVWNRARYDCNCVRSALSLHAPWKRAGTRGATRFDGTANDVTSRKSRRAACRAM